MVKTGFTKRMIVWHVKQVTKDVININMKVGGGE